MSATAASSYVPVGEVEVYYESRGEGGTPLVVVHGGFGVTTMFGWLLDRLAERRRVVAVELQGHGHTRDVEREFSYEAFGDDVAGVVEGLELGRADLLGYSVGAGASLRCAIQHPERVRKLALVSFPFRRDGWFPEVLAAFDHMGSALFPQLGGSPMYHAYAAVAPDPDGFPALMDKTGELQRRPYDWSDDVARLEAPTLLVYADQDAVPPSHAAEFFALLGGGLRDPGWDRSAAATESQLAVLPGLTHYDVFTAPQLAEVVDGFLG